MSYIRVVPFKPNKEWRKKYQKFKLSLPFEDREPIDLLVIELIELVRKDTKKLIQNEIKCLLK